LITFSVLTIPILFPEFENSTRRTCTGGASALRRAGRLSACETVLQASPAKNVRQAQNKDRRSIECFQGLSNAEYPIFISHRAVNLFPASPNGNSPVPGTVHAVLFAIDSLRLEFD